jgi:adenine deaminase
MNDILILQTQIRAALGEQPLDLLVRNVRLVDVTDKGLVEVRAQRVIPVIIVE